VIPVIASLCLCATCTLLSASPVCGTVAVAGVGVAVVVAASAVVGVVVVVVVVVAAFVFGAGWEGFGAFARWGSPLHASYPKDADRLILLFVGGHRGRRRGLCLAARILQPSLPKVQASLSRFVGKG